MKKLLALFAVLFAVISCDTEPKDYVTLSGTITNAHQDKTITIFIGQDNDKIITVNDDGTFSDTLKVEAGDYSFKHGDEYGTIFLKNDNTTSFTTDYNDFDNTLVFDGGDSDINNFAIRSAMLSQDYIPLDLIFGTSKDDLDNAFERYKEAYTELKTKYKNVDSTHITNADKRVPSIINSYVSYYNTIRATIEEFPAGSPSPIFENYENFKGGTTSLSDIKGKFVYVDVWATWCGPCKREIPSLKELEKKYEGRNIEFVSISVDNAKRSGTMEKAHGAWKKMVAEKELSGIQLFSDKSYDSNFMASYKVKGIPRFMLIDPEGKIVSAHAPRPSMKTLIALFDELKI